EHRKALMRRRRRGGDNLSLCLALLELLRRSLDAPEHASDVDLHNQVQILRRDVLERFDLHDARVVDHDVEATEHFFRMGYGGEYFVPLGDVRLEGRRLAAEI